MTAKEAGDGAKDLLGTVTAGAAAEQRGSLAAAEVRLVSGDLVTELAFRPGEHFAAEHFEVVLELVRRWSAKAVGSVQLLLGSRCIKEGDVLCDAGTSERCVLTAVVQPPSWCSALLGREAYIDEENDRVLRRQEQRWHNAFAVATKARRFEVRVLSSEPTLAGFLEFGFCDGVPESPPRDLISMRNAWVSSNCGNFYISAVKQQGWQWAASVRNALSTGDIITCAVTNGGSLLIAVNHTVVADWPAAIPDTADLHPVVDLYGKTAAVELLLA